MADISKPDMSWVDDFSSSHQLNERQKDLVNIHNEKYTRRGNGLADQLGLGYPGVVDLPNGDRMYMMYSGNEGFQYASPASGRSYRVEVDPAQMAQAQARRDQMGRQAIENSAGLGQGIRNALSGTPYASDDLYEPSYQEVVKDPTQADRYLSNPFAIMAAKADSLRNPEQADRYNQAVKNTQFANEAFRQQREAFLRGEGPEPTFRPSMQDAQNQLKNDQGFYAPNEGATARPTPAPSGYVTPGGGYENPFADYGGYPGREPPSGPAPEWDQTPIGAPGFGNPSGPIDGSPAPGGPNAPGNPGTTPGNPGTTPGGGTPGGPVQPPVAEQPRSHLINQWFGSERNPETGQYATAGGQNPTNEAFYNQQFNRMRGLRDQQREQQSHARGEWNTWQRQQNRNAQSAPKPQVNWDNWDTLSGREPTIGMSPGEDGANTYTFNSNLTRGMTNPEVFNALRGNLNPNEQHTIQNLLAPTYQGQPNALHSGREWSTYSSPQNLDTWLGKQGFTAERKDALNNLFGNIYSQTQYTTPEGGGPSAAPGYALPI